MIEKIERQPRISLRLDIHMLFVEALRLQYPYIHSGFYLSCKVLCMSVYTYVCIYIHTHVHTHLEMWCLVISIFCMMNICNGRCMYEGNLACYCWDKWGTSQKVFFFHWKQINLTIYTQNLIYYMHYLPFTTRAGPLHARLAALRMMYELAYFSLWQWIINLCIIGKW